MSKILNKDEFNANKHNLLRELKNLVLIYPTDTIYGIGCDATNEALVSKVRKIKKSKTPFSIIPPSKKWIFDNCEVTSDAAEWLKKLPGPYTVILKLKNKKAVAKSVNLELGTIGIRVPQNWFFSVVKDLNVPIISTSANISGENFMTELDDLSPKIKEKIDYIFYEGPIKGRPSTIVDLTKNEIDIKKR